MTLGLTSSGAVKIKTDGGLRAVNCACCESPCPEITSDYIVISEAMYNALRAGGTISGSGGGSEYTGCSFSGSVTGYAGLCNGSAVANGGVTCTIDGHSIESSIAISWEIAKVGSEYRILYSGGGSCMSDIYGVHCYTVGFFINSGYDPAWGGAPFTQVGTGTIATSAGSISFAIWNLDPSATAYLNINIT